MPIIQDEWGLNITNHILVLFYCELRQQARIPRKFTDLGRGFTQIKVFFSLAQMINSYCANHFQRCYLAEGKLLD